MCKVIANILHPSGYGELHGLEFPIEVEGVENQYGDVLVHGETLNEIVGEDSFDVYSEFLFFVDDECEIAREV